jgi:hypothetical protein
MTDSLKTIRLKLETQLDFTHLQQKSEEQVNYAMINGRDRTKSLKSTRKETYN